jgi:hypothetical protein
VFAYCVGQLPKPTKGRTQISSWLFPIRSSKKDVVSLDKILKIDYFPVHGYVLSCFLRLDESANSKF